MEYSLGLIGPPMHSYVDSCLLLPGICTLLSAFSSLCLIGLCFVVYRTITCFMGLGENHWSVLAL